MADKDKNSKSLSPSNLGAIQMLGSVETSFLSFQDKLANPTGSPIGPVTYAGKNVPAKNPGGTDAAIGTKFAASIAEEKPEDGISLLTWYMMANGRDPEMADQSDAEFAKSFSDFVKSLPQSIQDTPISFGGRQITIGQMADRLGSNYDSRGNEIADYGSPIGILGGTRMSSVSPQTVASLENMARKTGVLDEIQYATRLLGVDYGSMLKSIKQESGFDPHAEAPGVKNTAHGLCQFITKTWRGMINDRDNQKLIERAYMEHYGQRISISGMNDAEKMALRDQALANVVMGSKYAADLEKGLAKAVRATGFELDAGDNYLGRFLGEGGARQILKAVARNPQADAASLFPDAAASNPKLFYENGRHKSVEEVINTNRLHAGVAARDYNHPTLQIS